MVVDALEMIDIKNRQRQRPTAARCMIDVARQCFVEVTTIGQAGQRIFLRLALEDVGLDAQSRQQLALVLIGLRQSLRLQLQIFSALAHQFGQVHVVGLVATQQQIRQRRDRAKHRRTTHVLALSPKRQHLEPPHRASATQSAQCGWFVEACRPGLGRTVRFRYAGRCARAPQPSRVSAIRCPGADARLRTRSHRPRPRR